MAPALTVVKQPSRKEQKEAADALHESRAEYLDCRDLRHPWTVVGCFYVGAGVNKEVQRRLVCTRCGTEATDRWTPRGERLARVYKYAEGYTIKGVRIRPTDVRKEVLQRVTVFATEDEMLSSLFNGGSRKRA